MRAPKRLPKSNLDRRAAAVADLLTRVAADHAPAVLGTAFGAEGMVLIDLIARHALPIRIFTLDTGRLPEETYALIDRVRKQYGLSIDVYTPETRLVQALVREHGMNPFYDSVELRKRCCGIRKSEPLQRALVAKGAWITGLRRGQSVTRDHIALEETDAVHGLHKVNPLADWGDDEIWEYVRVHDVAYNSLHDRGYPSIGCAPCTRAVEPGDDIRAGRWWWEHPEHRECGIHRRPVHLVRQDPSAPRPLAR